MSLFTFVTCNVAVGIHRFKVMLQVINPPKCKCDYLNIFFASALHKFQRLYKTSMLPQLIGSKSFRIHINSASCVCFLLIQNLKRIGIEDRLMYSLFDRKYKFINLLAYGVLVKVHLSCYYAVCYFEYLLLLYELLLFIHNALMCRSCGSFTK